mgnify:CR=1 FL=1
MKKGVETDEKEKQRIYSCGNGVIISIFVLLLGIMVPSLNSILGFRVQRAANSIASALDKTKIEASNRLVGEMMLERREDGYYISYIIDRGKVMEKKI